MRLRNIYDFLLEEYGPQGWWPLRGRYFPAHEDPFEVAAGAVLTQNTSWSNASSALESLREARMLDPEYIRSCDRSALAGVIRSSGYHNQKAERLQALSRFFLESCSAGRIPGREELLCIRGIGPETADSILLYAFHVPVFVIDAYTRRLLSRAGLAREDASYGELQALFMENLPQEEGLFNEYHALIVRHGKDICRRMPHCKGCVLFRKGSCDQGR
jgi:endonuclease-3 related protein